MIKRQFDKLKEGYSAFREKYTRGVHSDMKLLAQQGQRPQFMVVACCDSRVDPAIFYNAIQAICLWSAMWLTLFLSMPKTINVMEPVRHLSLECAF